jgi:MFS transporter, OFA family, oxalate/formate antiporter
LFYGWVIVAACALMMAITYGLMYSYGIFFKPLADYFNWDRATVSLIYSASLIIRGAIAIGVGWLADRYGAIKLSVFCGFMIGSGLVLSSQVHTLWQFFLTYAVIEATGLSGAFGIGTTMISRWFTKNRGLPLGIISAGSGLGTLFIVPGVERIVSTYGWSEAFIVVGIVASVVMIAAAFTLRPSPRSARINEKKPESPSTRRNPGYVLKDAPMMLFMGSCLLFFFGVQIIMVHLVNYATDMGINPLTAATLISTVGAISIAGRLTTGVGADKIGLHNTLVMTRCFLVISFLCLIFSRTLWSFYLFAVIFGLCYGGEIPQIPLFVGKYWGTNGMATLMGLNAFITNIGGALGPWISGIIFDNTRSYQMAFIAGAIAGMGSLILILILRRKTRKQLEIRP